MEMLSEEKFAKMVAFVHSPAGQRVRTNNHVERTNRRLRFLEKVRYKWRRRKTLVRFVVMKLDALWSRWSPPEAKAKTTQEKPVKRRKSQGDDGLQPRRVA
jgi:hypothetical protein